LFIGLGSAIAALCLLVLVVVLLTGSERTLAGTFTVFDDNGCDLSWGYADIGPGTDVVITDDAGNTVGEGNLGAGEDGVGWCEFPFKVEDLPDSSSYGITISHRGTIDFDRDDLENDDWHVELSLGD